MSSEIFNTKSFLNSKMGALYTKHAYYMDCSEYLDKKIIRAIKEGKGISTTHSRKKLERNIKKYAEQIKDLNKIINISYLIPCDEDRDIMEKSAKFTHVLDYPDADIMEKIEELYQKMRHRVMSALVRFLSNKQCIEVMKLKTL